MAPCPTNRHCRAELALDSIGGGNPGRATCHGSRAASHGLCDREIREPPSAVCGRNQIPSRQERQERQENLNENTLQPWRSLRLCARPNPFSSEGYVLPARKCAQENKNSTSSNAKNNPRHRADGGDSDRRLPLAPRRPSVFSKSCSSC